MAIADLAIIGLNRGDISAASYIAEMHRRLRAQDEVTFELGSMGTILEGPPEAVFRVVQELHNVPFELGIGEVYTIVKIHDPRSRVWTAEDKVKAVERELAAGPAGSEERGSG